MALGFLRVRCDKKCGADGGISCGLYEIQTSRRRRSRCEGEEREILIRNQAELDQKLLLGQAEHNCSEVKKVLTEQAHQHVRNLESKLYENADGYVKGVKVEAQLKEDAAVRETKAEA